MSPSRNHSYLSYQVARAIDIGDKFNIHIELTLDIDGNDYVPDIALYERQEVTFLDDVIKMKELPLMVVEILSPTQSMTELTNKARLYLEKGIKSVWLVVPSAKTIIVFHDIHKPISYSTGMLVDSILDIEVSIEKIFK